MTRLQDELERVEMAEDLFALFELSYDPGVLRVHRLHIIKRFSHAVREIEANGADLDEDERWNRYGTALKLAHEYYQAGPPPGEHVFFGVQRGLVKLGSKPGR